MPSIKVVGNAKPISISQNLLERIVEGKTKNDPSHLVDVRGFGFVEIGQIKQIIPDDPGTLAASDEEKVKAAKRQRDSDEYAAQVAIYRRGTADEKAIRVARTWAQLLWTVRGNWKPEARTIPEDFVEKIVMRLLTFFEKNPTEWTCTRVQYEDLIPYNTSKNRVVSKIDGVVSIGQAMEMKLL